MSDSWEESDGRLSPSMVQGGGSKKGLSGSAKPFVFNPGAKVFTPGGPPPATTTPTPPPPPQPTGIRLAQEIATKGGYHKACDCHGCT